MKRTAALMKRVQREGVKTRKRTVWRTVLRREQVRAEAGVSVLGYCL